MTNSLITLKLNCLQNNIAIVRDQTIKYMCDLINTHKYNSLLEIGTAWGYSALYCQYNCSSLKTIDTIEKDIKNYNIALQNINSLNCNNINVINCDCYLFVPSKKYDVIFLDGPKSKLDILFNKYISYLNSYGVLFIDNIKLLKYRNASDFKINLRKQRVINNIDQFVNNLKQNNKYKVNIYDFDDGFAVIKIN